LNTGRYLDIVGKGRIVMDSYSATSNLKEIAINLNSAPTAERWLTRGNSIDRQPVYSPDGRWVMFSSSRGGNLDVWKVSLENFSLVRLTDDPGEDFDPAFSRDGKSITWSSTRGGHYEIWMADADGSGARQVTKDGIDAENGILTPDGEWIVYNSYNAARRGIWKIRSDGTQDTQLVSGDTFLPEISPDGQYSLYRLVDRISVLIRVVGIDDGKTVPFEIRLRQPERLLNSYIEGRARWMPNGKAIAFIGRDEKGATGVFVQDFVPGQDTSHTKRPIGGFNPDEWTESLGISPDGTRLTIGTFQSFESLLMAENVPGIEAPIRK
jgi:Tol biopolymer transport system component